MLTKYKKVFDRFSQEAISGWVEILASDNAKLDLGLKEIYDPNRIDACLVAESARAGDPAAIAIMQKPRKISASA
jgi:hypothetical protein